MKDSFIRKPLKVYFIFNSNGHIFEFKKVLPYVHFSSLPNHNFTTLPKPERVFLANTNKSYNV